MRDDLLDHWRFQDRRNDLQLATAVRAVRHARLEQALEQLGVGGQHTIEMDFRNFGLAPMALAMEADPDRLKNWPPGETGSSRTGQINNSAAV